MPSVIVDILSLLSETIAEFRKLKPNLIGAALAFYFIFSIGPLLLITTEFVDILVGGNEAEAIIIREVQTIAGPLQADIIQTILSRIQRDSPTGISLFISVPLLFFGATMIFFQLREALSVIWDVRYRPHKGFMGIAHGYFRSAVMVAFVGGLIVTVIALSSALVIASHIVRSFVHIPSIIISSVEFIVAFAALTVLFAMTYQILTEVTVRWRVAWIGACVTSFLFTVGQILISAYLTTTAVGSMRGAVGSFSVLVVWIFYSSQIFLIGAVFAKVYAHRIGHYDVHSNGTDSAA